MKVGIEMIDPLDGTDIGNTIARTNHEAVYEWPDDTAIQGGKSGIVLSPSGNHYRTAFVEAFHVDFSFIRGEGKTVAEAETEAWAQYQIALKCPSGGEHSYTPRRKVANGFTTYYNGAGFCENCNTFKSHCFTAEDLNLKCHTCGTYSYYSQGTENNERVFGCETHPIIDEALERLLDEDDDDEDE